MPIKRESSVPAQNSMVELLAYLQVEGYLRGVRLPQWAPGTSVEELLNAIRLIGDGEWLSDHCYPECSPQDAADRWLRNFVSGREVDVPSDIPEDDK